MSKTYQKYIILSSPRHGTNFLTALLNSHPMIISKHEIFRDAYLHDLPRLTPAARHAYTLLRHFFPVRYMYGHVYRAYPPVVRAVGFELLYFCPNEGQHAVDTVLEHIRNNPSTKIIHLRRENLLRAYLSYVVANRTRIWISTDPRKRSTTPVLLGKDDCRQYFITMQAYQKRYSQLLQTLDTLPIAYEQLCKYQMRTTQQILRFLAVPERPLTCQLIKLIIRPLPSMITNYDKLKHYFSKTEWASFFDE